MRNEMASRFAFMAFALTVAIGTGNAWAAGGGGSTSSGNTSSGIEAQYSKAVRAAESGAYNRAVGLLEPVVRSQPSNADAWNYLGLSYRKLSRFDEAMTAYKKALSIDPLHRGAHEYQGELYLQLGEVAKAEDNLRRLQGICGRGCEEYGDLREAIEAYKASRKSS